ncbi:MAG: hypothetical protein QM726_15300 [Chitinophagaceae bacterium]
MKLREQLLKEHSRANCDKIVKWVGKDQSRFDELFVLFLSDEYRVVQHAAWPISYAVIGNPQLIKKHFKKLVTNLDKPGIHDAVKRNTMRLLQDIDIPTAYHGRIMDNCFKYISTPGEPVAIKAFSLTVLEKLAAIYPDIIPEIKLLIEENYERETAAFKSRAKKLLKKW